MRPWETWCSRLFMYAVKCARVSQRDTMTSSPGSRSDCQTCRSTKPSNASTRPARSRKADTSSGARSGSIRRRESDTYMAAPRLTRGTAPPSGRPRTAPCSGSAHRLGRALAFALREHAAEDLPGRRLGDLRDDLDGAHALVRGDPLPHPCRDGLRREARLDDDERLGHLAGLLVRDADHRGVGDLGMRDEQRLELRRRDLETLVLDELLDPVDDREPAVAVDRRHVAGPQPAVDERRRRRVRVAQVALHDLRAADPQLAPVALRDVLVGQ